MLTFSDQVALKGNVLADLVFRGWPCPQRILMVTDGGLDFGTGGFGLSEFLSVVQSAGHTVSTAHRQGVAPVTIAGNFVFNNTVTTNNFDQIWLFGILTNATPLTAAEQTVIANFMQSGGGVFATGDHEDLGAGMGSHVLRVRSMRNWATIPVSGTTRLDTVVDPGVDKIYQFYDQSDAIPQRIYPAFFSNGGAQNNPSTWSPHPVLRHSSGAVSFLPDHPHESECLAPAPAAGNFAGVEEWPAPVGGGARIAPVIVATSVSGGRFLTDLLKPPVTPRCFGAISAYDGDAANVGRIVCDATWHHFININMNGTGALPDTTGMPRTGLYSGGMPTPEYLQIRTYWFNTVRWLAPKGRRFCWPWLVAALTRFDFEMRELKLPEPHPCPWDPLIRIGTIAEEVVSQILGRGVLAELVDDMLVATNAAPPLANVLKSRPAALGEEKRGDFSLLPLAEMRRAVFGSLVNLLARELPQEERALARALKEFNEERGTKLMAEAVRGAQQSINEYLGRAFESAAGAIKAMSADRPK